MNQSELFKRVESTHGFDNKLAIIADNDINCEHEPWAFLRLLFADLMDEEDPVVSADRVAEAFQKNSGPIIAEYESDGIIETIMDCMYSRNGMPIYPDGIAQWLIYRAFKNAGFKKARDCTKEELKHAYAKKINNS